MLNLFGFCKIMRLPKLLLDQATNHPIAVPTGYRVYDRGESRDVSQFTTASAHFLSNTPPISRRAAWRPVIQRSGSKRSWKSSTKRPNSDPRSPGSFPHRILGDRYDRSCSSPGFSFLSWRILALDDSDEN